MEKETFKDIPDYQGYQVSNLGRVKSLPKEWVAGVNSKRSHDGMILKSKNDNGYLRVQLCKKGKRNLHKISRLVMLAFHGKSDLHVNHINGIKTDDRLENLEYVTESENMIHARENNLLNPKCGEDHPDSILTEAQVRRIKWIAKYTNPKRGYWKKLADSLGVSKGTVYCIKDNKNWKQVQV